MKRLPSIAALILTALPISAWAEIALVESEIAVVEGTQQKEKRFEGDAIETRKKLDEMKRSKLPSGQKFVMRKVPPKLRFQDAAGKLNKEIELKSETKHSETTMDGKTVGVRESVSRAARVAANHKRAAIVESTEKMFETGESKEGADDLTSKFQLLDEQGGVVWEKNLPKFRTSGPGKLSADGSRVATIQAWEPFHQFGKREPTQLVVYDASGHELLAFPGAKKDGYTLYGDNDLEISPNGQYVAMRVARKNVPDVIVLDVNAKTLASFGREGFPIDVDDKGKTRVGLMAGAKVEVFDAAQGQTPIK